MKLLIMQSSPATSSFLVPSLVGDNSNPSPCPLITAVNHHKLCVTSAELTRYGLHYFNMW